MELVQVPHVCALISIPLIFPVSAVVRCLWPEEQASVFSLGLMLVPGPVQKLMVVVCHINNMGYYSYSSV